MMPGQSLESRDYERVKAYIAVRKQCDRTAILMGTGIKAGDVKAIAARLEKEGAIRIHELPTGGATYLWTGGPVQVATAGKDTAGVTAPAPAAAPGVTPEKPPEGVTRARRSPAPGVTPKKPRGGVTKASPRPRRGVTPKEKRELEILMDRAAEIERASPNGAGKQVTFVIYNNTIARIGSLSSIVGGLAECSSRGELDAVRDQLTRLASEALKWRIELLEPDQRELLNGLFGLTGDAT